ncbi:MAG TPA: ABC transporter permease, partial [Erythrobacter sp.]|nr:ABC transporter permease [Erythrobacter sp.]
MGGFAEYDLSEDGDGGNVLALSGPYLVSTVGAIDQDLRAL